MEPSDDDTAYDNRPLFPESSSHTETKLVSQDSEDDDETDNEHMLDVPISLSHTLQSGESPSCRTRGRFRQALLSFADPPSSPKKRQRSQQPAPTKEDLDKLDQTIAAEAEVPTNTDIPDAERALGRRFIPSWKQTYSWLSLKYNRVHRQYGMKCSVCSTFAPHTKSPFGRNGVGARDFQKSACKQHDFSKVHLAAMEAERLAQGTEVHQRTLVDMLSKDPMMARVVKCMQTAQWCAQKDAPVVLYPDLARFMAMQGCPDMVNYEAYGRYYSRYAFGEFTEVLAQHLSDQQLQDIKPSAWYGLSFDESTDRARGKHLIIYIMFERNEEVVNQFFGHLTLEKCDAVSIYNAILSFLHSKDLSLNMLVGVSTDGASVMTGSKGGVVALLRKSKPPAAAACLLLLPAAACCLPAACLLLAACCLPAAACLPLACSLPAACLLPACCLLPAACLVLLSAAACCCCLLPAACLLLAACCLPAASCLPLACSLPAACLQPACCLLPTACLLQPACHLPAACLPPACYLLPAAAACLPAACCLLPACCCCLLLLPAACLLPACCLPAAAACSLLPLSFCLLPAASCLKPIWRRPTFSHSSLTVVIITEVKNHVDKVKTKLAQWYVEPSASLGAKTRLAAFVAKHGDKDKREIIIKGADDDGSPARATIQLHEESIGAGGNDLDACYDLAKRFAQRLINTLGKRMADLRHFDRVLFFQPHEYPPRLGEREAWLKFHMSELLDMFQNQLPGVSAEDIEPQMHLFTATLDKKFKHQSFNQALTNMLRTSDWKDDYPTLVSLWRAISVLPLSTVECERGFSRQNIIKSWDRVALSDVRLGELMTVKMLDYAVDWAAAYAIFESKGRKTA
ncbi:unnamed protein product [Closterium sp. NIES-54]